MERQRWLIVHPEFVHTLAEPPLLLVGRSLCLSLQSCPVEIVHLIAGHLDSARDLCSFQAVNREFRDIASDDQLWRPLCQRHFSVPAHAEPDSWRELYRFNKNVFRELFMRSCAEQVESLGGGPIQLAQAAFF